MSAENDLFENIENFRKTLQTELLNGRTNFSQPMEKQEEIRRLNRWLNLLRSKRILLQILGVGNQESLTQDSSHKVSLTITALRNLTDAVSTNQLEVNKLKLAAFASGITLLTVNNLTEQRMELLLKKHELELQVAEMSKKHAQILEKLIETKKTLLQEADNFKNEINSNEQILKEMNRKQPGTVVALKHKTQEYICKANTARKFISTFIVACEVNLLAKPELQDILIKQRRVITLDNIKTF